MTKLKYVRFLALMAIVIAHMTIFVNSSKFCQEEQTRKPWRLQQFCRQIKTAYGFEPTCFLKLFYFDDAYHTQVCCQGYRGTACDIPICDNCNRDDGGICAAPDTCIVGSTQSCTSAKDCYPGVCNSTQSGIQCLCSAAFEGDNCQTMKEGPTLQGACAGRLYFQGSEVATANCEFNDNNRIITYTNARDFDTLEVEYDYTYTPDGDRPSVPPQGYLRSFRVGIVDTYMSIQHIGDDGQPISDARTERCNDFPGIGNNRPYASTPCVKRVPYSFNFFDFKHNQSLDIELVGQTGGIKEIISQSGSDIGQVINRTISGQRGSVHVTIHFDLKTPVHCSESDSCGSEAANLPLATLADITRNREVKLLFLGWTDDLSRVTLYRFSVYGLAPSIDGDLIQRKDPVIFEEYTNFENNPDFEPADSATFNLTESGLYSIVGEVHDWAGNIRYARALVLYADQQNQITTTGKNWTVTTSANTLGQTFWVTSETADLNISWDGSFVNSMLNDGQFLRPLRPLDASYGDYLDYSPRGNISTNGRDNHLGITSFEYSIQTLPDITMKPDVPEDLEFRQMNDLASQYVLTGRSSSRHQHLTFWVKAIDPLKNEYNDYRYIMTDTTKPTIGTASELVKNVKRENMTGYFSRVDVEISDLEGGIFRIDSELFDNTQPQNRRLMGSSTQMAKVVDKTPSDCTGREADCVCATSSDDQCYQSPQMIYIDNCVFKDYMSVDIVIKLRVFNRALLSAEKEIAFPPVGELDGIDFYPPVERFRVKMSPNSALVTWYLPVACYDIYQVRISTTYDGAKPGEIPDITVGKDAVEAELSNLINGRKYTAEIVIIYENRQESEKVPLTFTIGPAAPSARITAFLAVEVTYDRALVAWQLEPESGEGVSEVTLTIRPSSSTLPPVVLSPSVRKYLMKNLIQGRNYIMEIFLTFEDGQKSEKTELRFVTKRVTGGAPAANMGDRVSCPLLATFGTCFLSLVVLSVVA